MKNISSKYSLLHDEDPSLRFPSKAVLTGLSLLSATVMMSACSGGNSSIIPASQSPFGGGSGLTPDSVNTNQSSASTSTSAAATTSTGRTTTLLTQASGSKTVGKDGTSWTTEYPQGTGKFVDSIGIDIHLGYGGTPYSNHFNTMKSQLAALGIHHVRDAVHPGQSDICEQNKELRSIGIGVSYVTNVNESMNDITGWASCVGNAMDDLEGPNEYDISHPSSDTNWPHTLASYQAQLWNTAKTASVLSGIKVLGPPLTSGGAYNAVGDLSNYEDYGNMHDYLAGRNPGTPGWGDGGYGSIAYNVNIAKSASVSKPIIATETGWGISNTQTNGDVSEWAAGKYVPRMYMESFMNNVPRTYSYELYDEGTAPFNNYGWIRSDSSLAPRWSYWAMKNLISVLADNNVGYTSSSPVSYNISGAMSNVHHLLLQKSDSSVYLAMWVEDPNNDPNSGKVDAITTQTVTVTVPTAPRQASLYQYDSRMNLMPRGVAASTSFNVNLVDTVSLLRLKW